MQLSWEYKWAHYLMRTKDAFDVVVRAIRSNETPPRPKVRIAHMLDKWTTC